MTGVELALVQLRALQLDDVMRGNVVAAAYRHGMALALPNIVTR